MSETKRCPQCQAEIPAAAPEGLCPQCLLQAGLESKTVHPEPQTAAYTPRGAGFVPPTPAALQPAFPQLEILELLGKGGMGAVYKARQPGLDRLVAVKILPPEVSHDPAFAERFTREARALAMLNHPNIVGVYDFGQTPSPPSPLPPEARGGYWYFVMEYVDGVNIRQAMRAGELKSAQALKIVPQICEALQFAHDEGIVHRDIKPENILLDKKGRVKIADFGLAKLLGKTHDVTLTGTQQIMGTLQYMAPEQIEGARDVDHRADIYSLGVTFYEMLTGELPIGRFAAPSKKVQIDVRLDEVVLRSLEKSPEQRYQHASEIKTDVETIASGRVAAPAGPSTAKLDMPISVPYAGVIPTGPFDLGAFGMLHFDGVFLEFEITKRGFFSNSRLQSVRIPLAEVKSMWVEKGKPPGWGLPAPRLWSLYLRTNRMRALDDLPFGSQGQVQIFLEPANVAAAQELQSAVLRALQRNPSASEIKTEVEGIAREPAAPPFERRATARPENAAVKRPWGVPILAVINGVIAVTSVFLAADDVLHFGDNGADMPDDEWQRQLFNALHIGSTVGGYLVSLVIIVAAVGLLFWKPWARWLSIASAVFRIALWVIALPLVIVFAFNWLATNELRLGVPELIILAVIGIPILCAGTIYQVFVVVYLTRPRIIAAFSPLDQQSAPPSDAPPVLGASRPPSYLRTVVFPVLALFALWWVAIVAHEAIALRRFGLVVAVGGAFVILAFLLSNVVWLWRKLAGQRYRHESATKTLIEATAGSPAAPRPVPSASVSRPWMVPILGFINVIVGVFMLFIAASSFLYPEPIPADAVLRPIYDVWVIVDPVVAYATAALWFVAGIGLALWQPWARRLTVVLAWVQLGLFVLTIPFVIAFSIEPAFAQADKAAAPHEQGIYFMFLFIVFGGSTVTLLAYLIAVLIYFTRPRIIAAFGPRADQPAASA